jgi:hypothetical protein
MERIGESASHPQQSHENARQRMHANVVRTKRGIGAEPEGRTKPWGKLRTGTAGSITYNGETNRADRWSSITHLDCKSTKKLCVSPLGAVPVVARETWFTSVVVVTRLQMLRSAVGLAVGHFMLL